MVFLLLHAKSVIGEGRIAEAVSEGEQRFSRRIQIFGRKFALSGGPSCGRVIVVDRALAVYVREGGRQLPARRFVSEQDTRDSISHLNAQMPRFDHHRKVLRLPSHGQRPAVHKDCDDRFSRRHKFCEHLSLPAGKRDVRLGGSFSGHSGGLTYDRYNHVAVRAGRSDLLFVEVSGRSSAGIIGNFCACIIKSVQNSDAVLFLPAHRPGAGHFIGRICEGADQADLLTL